MTDPFQSSSRFSSSSAYKLADSDSEFLQRDELRAVRLQLEWFKPELIQQVEYGLISLEDLSLFHFAETAAEAWKIIMREHQQGNAS